MFLYVKYGNDQEIMININCRIINLLRYIKKIANTDENELELCDITGDVKFLQANIYAYTNTLLKEKERYILLKTESKYLIFFFLYLLNTYILKINIYTYFSLSIRKGKNGEIKPTYVPLLNNELILTEDFQNKLNALKKKSSQQATKKQGAKQNANKQQKQKSSQYADDDD